MLHVGTEVVELSRATGYAKPWTLSLRVRLTCTMEECLQLCMWNTLARLSNFSRAELRLKGVGLCGGL